MAAGGGNAGAQEMRAQDTLSLPWIVNKAIVTRVLSSRWNLIGTGRQIGLRFDNVLNEISTKFVCNANNNQSAYSWINQLENYICVYIWISEAGQRD